jgi:hypothetical protein
MKATRVKIIASTDNHEYTTQVVINLEEVIAYEISMVDDEVDILHLYLSSGRERDLEGSCWDKDVLTNLLAELDNHFFPPNPMDDGSKPTKIDFYYF